MPPAIKKRNRLIKVCVNCYKKKIKCDRNQPCCNCAKGSLICEYIANSSKAHYHRSNGSKQVQTQFIASIDDGDSSILDAKLGLLSKVVLFTKPSRTFIRSPLISLHSFPSGLIGHCTIKLRERFTKERIAWKQKNIKNQISMSNVDLFSDESLIISINSIVPKNYNSIVERLNYFQVHLNTLLFNQSVPIELLHVIFNSYFISATNEIIFKKPKMRYEYQPIALILLLVDLVELFTKSSTGGIFQHMLTVQNNKFTELAVRLLNYSDFTTNKSVFSIHSVLCVTLTMMIYGDIQGSGFDYIDSYALFQTGMNIALGMGLHLDLNRVVEPQSKDSEDVSFAGEISINKLKRLWNLLILLDSEYLLYDFQSMINLKFCHGLYLDVLDHLDYLPKCIAVMRSIPEVLITLKNTNLRELIKLSENVKSVLSTMVSFNNISLLEKDIKLWPQVSLKLKLSTFHSLLCFFISYIIEKRSDELNTSNLSDTCILDKVQERMNQNFKLNFLYIMKFQNDVYDYAKDDRFFVFLKQELWYWFGPPTCDFVQYVFLASIKTNKKIDLLDNGLLPNPSIDEIENVFFNDSNTESFTSCVEPSVLLKFLTLAYNKSVKLLRNNLNYDMFLFAKICSILMVLLKVYMSPNIDYSTTSHIENIRKIISLADTELKKRSAGDVDSNIFISTIENDEEDRVNIYEPSAIDRDSELPMEEIMASIFGTTEWSDIINDLNTFMSDPNNIPEYLGI